MREIGRLRLGLLLRNEHSKRNIWAKLIRDRGAAVTPPDGWVANFVFDRLATGQKLRVLTVIDAWSKSAPEIAAQCGDLCAANGPGYAPKKGLT